MANRKQQAHRLGLWAELLCALTLTCKGYRVLALRHRSPAGEIDIVARRGKLLLIVEVKARKHSDDAFESVDMFKRQRLARAAEALMGQSKFAGLARSHDLTMRFDVMAVRPWRLPVHMRDAFRPEL